jgi:hypothetical protein
MRAKISSNKTNKTGSKTKLSWEYLLVLVVYKD